MNFSITLARFGTALALVFATALSFAQTSGADRASAEALFGEGVSLVAAGNYESGCRKFEASQALDATLGTELRLADCYERAGKSASAWATFKHAQGLARVQGQADREQLARERVEALEPQLAYLSVTFEGARPPGLVVQRNGAVFPLASLGVAVPVDPGTQQLSASAPDHESWQETVDVGRGPGKTSLKIPALAENAARPVTPAPAPAAEKPAFSSTQRSAGIVTGAVGVVSILAGSGFGLYAKNQGDLSKRDAFCPNDNHNGCTAEGVNLRDKARTFGTASTVTFIAGAALLTTGIVLFSSAPSKGDDQVHSGWQLRAAAAPAALAASVRGTW